MRTAALRNFFGRTSVLAVSATIFSSCFVVVNVVVVVFLFLSQNFKNKVQMQS